jgi:hypothetical protein
MNNNSEFIISKTFRLKLDSLKKKAVQSRGDTIYSEWFYKGSVHVDFTRIELNFKRRTYASGKLIWISTILNLELMEMFLC